MVTLLWRAGFGSRMGERAARAKHLRSGCEAGKATAAWVRPRAAQKGIGTGHTQEAEGDTASLVEANLSSHGLVYRQTYLDNQCPRSISRTNVPTQFSAQDWPLCHLCCSHPNYASSQGPPWACCICCSPICQPLAPSLCSSLAYSATSLPCL